MERVPLWNSLIGDWDRLVQDRARGTYAAGCIGPEHLRARGEASSRGDSAWIGPRVRRSRAPGRAPWRSAGGGARALPSEGRPLVAGGARGPDVGAGGRGAT